jgi:hypothetical protein
MNVSSSVSQSHLLLKHVFYTKSRKEKNIALVTMVTFKPGLTFPFAPGYAG